MLKSRILPATGVVRYRGRAAAISQTAPDYPQLLRRPTEPTRIASSTPTARRRSGLRSSARAGMKILDIERI